MTNISTPAARRRALRDLIAQAATEDRFDMGNWAAGPDYRIARTPAEAAEFHHARCGTVACAAGWAVTLMTDDEIEELNEYSERIQEVIIAAWLGIPTEAFHVEEWGCVVGPLAAAASQITAERPLTRREQAEAFCNYLDTLNNIKDSQP